MGLSEEIRQKLIATFKDEQREHVQNITTGLLALEKKPRGKKRQTIIDDVFREAHSLKGAAKAIGISSIGSLGHALEGLLLLAKEGKLKFSADLFDMLYQTLDAIELIMQQFDSGDTTPSADVLALLARLEEKIAKTDSESAPLITPDVTAVTFEDEDLKIDEEEAEQPVSSNSSNAIGEETIRVSIHKLDALMAQFSELLAAKIRAEQRLSEVREMQQFATDWQKESSAIRPYYSRLTRAGENEFNGFSKEISTLLEYNNHNQELLNAFNIQSNTLYRQFANDIMRLSLIIDELQEEIKRVRMLPLSSITATFGRMVRDLAREQNKSIDFIIRGEETELDKRVLEQIKDPLIHLLRNAVDHGMDLPEVRQKRGKAEEGRITLDAHQQGNNIVIKVHDDGQGLNLDRIRKTAVQKGFMTEIEVNNLSDTEVMHLVFHSGLSTSEIITNISGRGVGLDVVRKNVEDLHGTLNVKSKPGMGTTFTMRLPLTLASSHGLVVEAGGQMFALPLTTVERMLQVDRNDIATVEGKEAITYEDKPVALAHLEDLLELPPTSRIPDKVIVVIITVAEKRLGLIVDNLAGEQEIVMKSLGSQLTRVGGIAGATVLGSGEVILVLHPADLVKLAANIQPHSYAHENNDNGHGEPSKRKPILVVDDSITTRTLEKNILEAAGYEVTLATNGEEAFGLLAANGLPSLIVSDVNMPRLDGFGLTHRVKQDNRYKDVPVILVTSLDSPADKARGIEVGADAYIVKSSFDQGGLLETIEQLIL